VACRAGHGGRAPSCCPADFKIVINGGPLADSTVPRAQGCCTQVATECQWALTRTTRVALVRRQAALRRRVCAAPASNREGDRVRLGPRASGLGQSPPANRGRGNRPRPRARHGANLGEIDSRGVARPGLMKIGNREAGSTASAPLRAPVTSSTASSFVVRPPAKLLGHMCTVSPSQALALRWPRTIPT
jgi:hypothetical protein